MSGRPKVIVLGGCGFIGRNVVQYLVENSLCTAIRVVDIIPPKNFWLNVQHRRAMYNPVVEYLYADLHWPDQVEMAFAPTDRYRFEWDFVINCAGESRFGLRDQVYHTSIVNLSGNCAREAARRKVKRFIEMSSGCMNSDTICPGTKEDCPIDPWTTLTRFKHLAECNLETIADLKYTVIRLPLVYGFGDIRYLTPRILLAGIYMHKKRKMNLLWPPERKLNTVHVRDVAAAAWFLCHQPEAERQIYNLADDQNTSQGYISKLLGKLFEIETGFWGVVISSLSRVHQLYDIANEFYVLHEIPFLKICEQAGLQHTPLSPHIPLEFLRHKYLQLDTTKIKALGFRVSVPALTEQHVMAIIRDYYEERFYPEVLLPPCMRPRSDPAAGASGSSAAGVPGPSTAGVPGPSMAAVPGPSTAGVAGPSMAGIPGPSKARVPDPTLVDEYGLSTDNLPDPLLPSEFSSSYASSSYASVPYDQNPHGSAWTASHFFSYSPNETPFNLTPPTPLSSGRGSPISPPPFLDPSSPTSTSPTSTPFPSTPPPPPPAFASPSRTTQSPSASSTTTSQPTTTTKSPPT